MKKSSVAIIGAGRLGGALAIALSEKSYSIKEIVVRKKSKIPQLKKLIKPESEILTAEEIGKICAEIVFITTQDSEIENAAESFASVINYKPFVFHTSGSQSSANLKSLADKGCLTASLHPAVAVSDAVNGAKLFRDARFCLEGNAKAVALGQKIVGDLGGVSFTIGTKNKSLYHAAAVMASGHIVSVFSAAVEMLAKCGLSEEAAQTAFLPLIKSAVANLANQTPAEALTGTFARADVETMKQHLNSLHENELSEMAEIYAAIGLRSIMLAAKQGANPKNLSAMKKILEKEKI